MKLVNLRVSISISIYSFSRSSRGVAIIPNFLVAPVGFQLGLAHYPIAESLGGWMLLNFRRVSAAFSVAFLGVLTTPALAQDSYADPAGSGVFVSAVNWLQGTLLGTFATVAAVIAVASVGFMMLTGRINWRHGAVVILGCFILFGAGSIVAGIQSAAATPY